MEKQRTQRSLRTKREVTPEGFEVTLEQVVGFVAFGNGDTSPVEAAFNLIGDHVWRNGEGGRFRFPGPEENQELVITVEHTTR